MRTVFPLLLAALLMSTAAFAQSGTPIYPTVDAGAVLVARANLSTRVEIEIEAKRKGDNIAMEIFVWRTSGNAVALEINSPSITPETATAIDEIPTVEIYRQLALGAVKDAIARGYITQGIEQTVGVWYASNVERTGTAMATRFAPCASYSAASRNFQVAWTTGGEAVVTELAAAATPMPCGVQSGSVQ